MTVLRADELKKRGSLVNEAKQLFPDKPEIQQAIHSDNGQEIIRLLNEAIGPGYSPNPNDILQLIEKGRINIIKAQAQLAINRQNFYSKCVKIYAST